MNNHMLTVYAVRVVNGEKHRHMIGTCENIDAAKHLCNCAVSGNADYAYVKDFGDGTVFYMKSEPSPYGEGDFPLEQCRPIVQALAS